MTQIKHWILESTELENVSHRDRNVVTIVWGKKSEIFRRCPWPTSGMTVSMHLTIYHRYCFPCQVYNNIKVNKYNRIENRDFISHFFVILVIKPSICVARGRSRSTFCSVWSRIRRLGSIFFAFLSVVTPRICCFIQHDDIFRGPLDGTFRAIFLDLVLANFQTARQVEADDACCKKSEDNNTENKAHLFW